MAASGTLAQIIPPSLVLIIMADQVGRSVGDMYKGAFTPAFMLVGLDVLYVVLLAIFRPACVPALPPQARTFREANGSSGYASLTAVMALSIGTATVLAQNMAAVHTWWLGRTVQSVPTDEKIVVAACGGVALALLQLLGRQKSQRIQLCGKSGLKAGQQRRIARHPARFQPGRAGGDVLLRRLQTLRHGAHAVAHLQAHIPAGGHEGRYRSIQRSWRPGLIRQQHQHIHIRKRKQLAAPVAAHRRQRPRQARALPQGGQRFIGQTGQRRHRARQARSRRCGQGARPHVIQQRLALAAVARAQGGQRVSGWIGGRAGFGSRGGHGRA